MKKLILKNKSYKVLITNYKEWLDILGFADSTVYSFPIHLQEFFYYLEQHNINSINHIRPTTVSDYYKYLQERPNEKYNGALSKTYLNTHQQVLKKFRDYLRKHNTNTHFNVPLKPERVDRIETIDILTQEEIKALFKAVEYSSELEHIVSRNKAMLVLLYSCGLRRNETIMMNIKDILFDKGLVLVRKGKNYKERFVPINHYNLELLENYIYDARIQFNNYNTTEALLIGQSGNRIRGNDIARHLKTIINATSNEAIQAKNITPHKLRHSIATHFLQAGMDIEYIKQFLGHAYLETTQIYTHLVEKYERL
ncbi:tyrosine-type recombinase/integrase [uncultured Lacinutrix sp.]|uniref:tyrosine-type recombinase/integrase n=1 Tax=uncultured Lacinutrix sp. TaxID=574032 RepID=UPI0026269492|nr:tyrosine-type recombinase/integrase [uncultured Lacinutrix sp.]